MARQVINASEDRISMKKIDLHTSLEGQKRKTATQPFIPTLAEMLMTNLVSNAR